VLILLPKTLHYRGFRLFCFLVSFIVLSAA